MCKACGTYVVLMSYVVSLCREHSYPIISVTTKKTDGISHSANTFHIWNTSTKTSRIPYLVTLIIRGLHYHAPILNTTTVHQRIVDPRRNFEQLCDWLKTGHVVWLLVFFYFYLKTQWLDNTAAYTFFQGSTIVRCTVNEKCLVAIITHRSMSFPGW
jgi:hypothetical protein